jgi:hypothetical protein
MVARTANPRPFRISAESFFHRGIVDTRHVTSVFKRATYTLALWSVGSATLAIITYRFKLTLQAPMNEALPSEVVEGDVVIAGGRARNLGPG